MDTTNIRGDDDNQHQPKWNPKKMKLWSYVLRSPNWTIPTYPPSNYNSTPIQMVHREMQKTFKRWWQNCSILSIANTIKSSKKHSPKHWTTNNVRGEMMITNINQVKFQENQLLEFNLEVTKLNKPNPTYHWRRIGTYMHPESWWLNHDRERKKLS